MRQEGEAQVAKASDKISMLIGSSRVKFSMRGGSVEMARLLQDCRTFADFALLLIRKVAGPQLEQILKKGTAGNCELLCIAE